MRRAEQLITIWVFNENLRRASKENIAIIKHKENKIGNECSGSFNRKILSD